MPLRAPTHEPGGPGGYVITPGQSDLVAEMVGADPKDLGGCRLLQAGIDKSVVRATYQCGGGPAQVVLAHPSAADAPLGVVGELALVAGDPPPPPELVAALTARLRLYEGRWRWTAAAPKRTGELLSAPRRPPSPWPLLWVPLLPLAVLSLWRAFRRLGRADRLGLAALSAVALAARALYEHLPLNWREDFAGPADAVSAAPVRMGWGYGDLFAFLDQVVPVRSSAVFALDVLASTTFTVLVTAALLRASRRVDGIPRVVPWLFGVLVATDYALVCLGASSAVQNMAALAFAVGLAWFAEAMEQEDRRAVAWRLALSGYACALVGLTRPDLGPAVLLVPAYMGLRPREWLRPRTLAFLGVGLTAAIAAVALWASEGLSARVVPVTTQTVGDVLHHAASASPLGYHPTVIAALSLAALAYSLFVNRRWLPLFVGWFAMLLPRAASDFHGVAIGTRLVTLRYDILVLPVLLLWVALGVAALRYLARPLGARSGLWATALVVAALFVPRALPSMAPRVWTDRSQAEAEVQAEGLGLLGRLFPPTRLSLRAEYAFLRDNLSRLPQGASLLVVWASGVILEDETGRKTLVPPDLDLGLAPGYPLLLFDRRDIRWIVHVPTLEPDPLEAEATYYYRGPFCDVDPGRHIGGESPEAFQRRFGITQDRFDAFLARARDDCRREVDRVTRWVAEWEGPGLTIGYARLETDRVRLGLGLLAGPDARP